MYPPQTLHQVHQQHNLTTMLITSQRQTNNADLPRLSIPRYVLDMSKLPANGNIARARGIGCSGAPKPQITGMRIRFREVYTAFELDALYGLKALLQPYSTSRTESGVRAHHMGDSVGM